MNLDAVLRIAARVTGTEAVQQLNRALGAAGRTADDAKKSFKNVVDSSAWQGAAVVATGIGVALGLSARAAIEFESAVADVRKVMNDLDSQGLQEIRGEILQLSREMPITAQGFAQIYAAAGSSGIAREELRTFARDVAQMSIAFDMTAADAGNAMAKMRTALGLTQPQVVDLADALNFLSNNTASTAAELVRFTQRAGVVGQQAGLSAERTAAFGAAMIGAGVETEVAATSFNNMIRALARGASMTARQESALQRLGLASRTVAAGEREMTAAVQRGSDRRLEIIQDESDRQQNELRKRYRRQLQLLEDQWEDQSDSFADFVRDDTDEQIRALQRQTEKRIEALEKQYKANEKFVDEQSDLLRDQLADEIDKLRRHADRTIEMRQRADRDQRQSTRDRLDEELNLELRAIEKINGERVRAEKEGTAEALAAAKDIAEQGGSEAGRALAKRLQDDALGTIRDVFQRIRGLAAEEQISVISDLFGDEARGLAPLIANMAELERALGMVADKTQYAGSMQAEYEQRAATTANKMQLLKNSIVPLQIAIGEALVPVIETLTEALTPMIAGATRWIEANPQLASGISLVAAALAGLVASLPFLATIGTIASGVAPFIAGLATVGASLAGIGATIAGYAAVLLPAITALKAFVATVAAVVAGIAAAPVAVTVAIAAAVVAVIAGVVVFRKEIGGFFTWLADAAIAGWSFILSPLRPALDAVVGAWRTLLGAVGAVYSGLATLFWQTYIEPAQVAFAGFQRLFIEGWNTVVGVVAPIVQNLVQGITSALQTLAKAYMDNMITPIIEGATSVWELLAEGWRTLSSTVSGIFRAITSTFQRFVVQPLTQAWEAIVDTARGAIRGLLSWAANAVNGLISIINRLIGAINQVRGAAGLSALATVGQVQIPAFAKGGYVSSPTVGLIGEADREYVVPEAKVAGFANNIMAGRRGAAAIPSGVSGTGGGGSVQISITTGPVRQDADGQRWLTMEDGERMVREAVAQMQRTNRTPAGRFAMGVR